MSTDPDSASEPLRAEVARQVRELRQLRGMSQAQLARASRLGQATISRVEQLGDPGAGATLGTLERIASALGVNLKVEFASK